ncbi:NAD(P)-dependent oxidoreductase [Kitasatospora sp. NBC_00240]|uniref:NAD-dependent epimerase/dehydratase family protein n=1 Tax=Kitasatospora sp. NBC_00240 TaxID=2903567 RepID=UPI002250725C|nr:NAD(P)-dependent oxidoreductase [Kitasatospora sp. NBC_00240]MCX5214716.1 NAD(P)-dependent oxidoreductase [Kitasatospora sp. NBC_00240]
MPERIVLTGAAGGMGRLMRPRLARPGRSLRLVDIAPLAPPDPDEDVDTVQASVADLPAMERACEGADALIHLGGLSTEGPWEQILETNIHGTYVVLEAARRSGVPRVILASSSHAVGFHPRQASEVPDYLFPRPDTFYGVSKAAGEALGSLYHDRYGLDVICLRIGACREKPSLPRQLATWLSPDDGARLLEAALTAPAPGFRVAWGVSANTRRWFSLAEAHELGYRPRDDAEQYAAGLDGEPADGLDNVYLGGTFCSPELDAEITP